MNEWLIIDEANHSDMPQIKQGGRRSREEGRSAVVLFVYRDGIVERRVMTAVYVEMLWSKWRRSVCVCVCVSVLRHLLFALVRRHSGLARHRGP